MNILHETPNAEEFVALRVATGFSAKDVAVAETALRNSLFAVVIRGDAGDLIGMGRIIGDGGCYLQVVDLLINPDHRGDSPVELIMHEITGYLDQHAPADASVILMADVPAVKFYQKYGFDFTYPESISLIRK